MENGIRSMVPVPVYKIRQGPSAAEKAAEHSLCIDRLIVSGRSLLCTWLALEGVIMTDQPNRSKLSKLFVAGNSPWPSNLHYYKILPSLLIRALTRLKARVRSVMGRLSKREIEIDFMSYNDLRDGSCWPRANPYLV